MKCPGCFSGLRPDRYTYACDAGCSVERSAAASSVRGVEVRSAPTVPLGAPGVVVCPKCTGTASTEVCSACLYPLPPDIRSATVTCLAMAGARNTGKSLLIAVAVQQLQVLVERHHRSTLAPQGTTQRRFDEHYRKALYGEGRLLEPTASVSDGLSSIAREPLVWAYTERSRDGSASRRRILAVRDVAGEDLEAEDRGHALGFLSRASAVLCLVDPLKVTHIKNLLADLVPPTERLGGEGDAVLRHVLALMSPPGRSRTSVPVGVVLSKVDVLQKLRKVEGNVWSEIMNRPGSPLQRDPSLSTGAFDSQDADLLDEEVKSLMEHLKAADITHLIADHVEQHRYFAVSALGESPVGEKVHRGGIAPFRAIDPFKWALSVPT